ncbi:MAG: hypothetical protein IJE46_01005 [Clostridia bacterium]|nr:hypothetical protein [Clostridia bacterium]
MQRETSCEACKNTVIEVVSFGFKHGIPQNADLVFDVRFLPNPFYVDELKPLTGLDERVSEYVKKFDETKEFIHKLFDMIDFLVPQYMKGSRLRLVIAIGCTGGKHRSVTIAEELYNHLKESEYKVVKHHSDIQKQ